MKPIAADQRDLVCSRQRDEVLGKSVLNLIRDLGMAERSAVIAVNLLACIRQLIEMRGENDSRISTLAMSKFRLGGLVNDNF